MIVDEIRFSATCLARCRREATSCPIPTLLFSRFARRSSGDVGSTFTFSPTTAGHVVHLCYKFDNEPYQVYPLMKMRVHHVTSMSSFQGDKSYIVAHVKERLAINGSFVTASDYGRWVKGTASTDADCEDTSFVLKSDDIASGIIQTNSEEPIVVNQTLAEVTPNQERDGKQVRMGRELKHRLAQQSQLYLCSPLVVDYLPIQLFVHGRIPKVLSQVQKRAIQGEDDQRSILVY